MEGLGEVRSKASTSQRDLRPKTSLFPLRKSLLVRQPWDVLESVGLQTKVDKGPFVTASITVLIVHNHLPHHHFHLPAFHSQRY